MESSYDSKADTLEHIHRVSSLLGQCCKRLLDKAESHDNTKLSDKEKPLFDYYSQKLKGCDYGSPEYKEFLEGLKPALEHHYKYNRHHPEHYEDGVNDMDLFDIMEMFMDWKAASERHDTGDIYKSININMERFGLSNQLIEILINTAKTMGWKK